MSAESVERRRAAEELLRDTFDLDEECQECELPLELSLIFGDEDCAIGVSVCPNCGHYGRTLTADPAGVATEHPYDLMFRTAMRWVPPWHPGREDVTSDWRCACGQTWKSSHKLRVHALQEHPDQLRMSMHRHDRYPWRSVPRGSDG